MTVVFTNLDAIRSPGSISVVEMDGSPSTANVSTLKLTNNTLTDNGDGSVSIAVGSGIGNGDVLGPAASVDGEVVLFSGTGGKTLKRSTLTGIIKTASGVQQVATPGTDYAPATTGTAILKGDGAGGHAAAVARTDYAEPTTALTTGILKNTVTTGAHTIAQAGTDYLAPAGSGASLTNMTKSQVGLSNVDNTTDAGKPVSTAQQTALDLKANLASPTFTGTVGGITKTMVGLGSVDNTTDTGKPVSTAQQTALDLKANLASPTFTGTVGGVTASMVGLGSVDNTSDVNKPVSSATTTQLNLKAPSSNPSFTGNVNLLLSATENVVIDARTYPRMSLTTGVLRINHTAGKTGTRPFALDIDCAGFADTHAISIDYTATGLTPGSENHGFDFSVDTSTSTGGEISAVSVSKSGTGLANVMALEIYPGVGVINQQVGVIGVADSNFTYSAAAYTLQTAAFDSVGTNVPIFVVNTDYIYIGHSIKFNVIDVALSIPASGGGIIPTFEYSDGVNSFALFSPGDTTNGFRQNGTIALPELTSWVTRTVNGVTSKYWIRIRRTNAAAITAPTESTIKIIVSTQYSWTSLGNVSASKLNLKNLPTYTTRANAIAAGLIAGDVFQDTNYSLWII